MQYIWNEAICNSLVIYFFVFLEISANAYASLKGMSNGSETKLLYSKTNPEDITLAMASEIVFR